MQKLLTTMSIFHDFLVADAKSIDRRGFLREQNVLRNNLSLDAVDLSSPQYKNSYEHFDSRTQHHHNFIRRLASNATTVDDMEQGSPTTVAIVSIILFIFIISLFFLLSCFMWCFSKSGSYVDEECGNETQMTPKERAEHLQKVLETKMYVLESVVGKDTNKSISSEIGSTIAVDDLSAEHMVDVSAILASGSSDDGKRQCAICLENFTVGDLISTSSINLECTHQFHQPCIMEWCMKQSDCPCCRRELLFLRDADTVAMDNIESYRSDFTRSILDGPEE